MIRRKVIAAAREVVDYEIMRYGQNGPYRIRYRDPYALSYWGGRWKWFKLPGIYESYMFESSTCHDAEVAIDEDVRRRIARYQGWVPAEPKECA